MRKTTEELWKEAGGNSLTDYGVECVETFRRLVIENERECAEVVAWRTETGYEQPFYLYHELKPIRSNGEALFTFPPAAQVPEVWMLGTKTWMQLFATEQDANEFQKGSGASTWIQPVKMHVNARSRAGGEMKSCYVVMSRFYSPMYICIPTPKAVFYTLKEANDFSKAHNTKRNVSTEYYVRKAQLGVKP